MLKDTCNQIIETSNKSSENLVKELNDKHKDNLSGLKSMQTQYASAQEENKELSKKSQEDSSSGVGLLKQQCDDIQKESQEFKEQMNSQLSTM